MFTESIGVFSRYSSYFSPIILENFIIYKTFYFHLCLKIHIRSCSRFIYTFFTRQIIFLIDLVQLFIKTVPKNNKINSLFSSGLSSLSTTDPTNCGRLTKFFNICTKLNFPAETVPERKSPFSHTCFILYFIFENCEIQFFEFIYRSTTKYLIQW